MLPLQMLLQRCEIIVSIICYCCVFFIVYVSRLPILCFAERTYQGRLPVAMHWRYMVGHGHWRKDDILWLLVRQCDARRLPLIWPLRFSRRRYALQVLPDNVAVAKVAYKGNVAVSESLECANCVANQRLFELPPGIFFAWVRFACR